MVTYRYKKVYDYLGSLIRNNFEFTLLFTYYINVYSKH